jgi:hypothetical protein
MCELRLGGCGRTTKFSLIITNKYQIIKSVIIESFYINWNNWYKVILKMNCISYMFYFLSVFYNFKNLLRVVKGHTDTGEHNEGLIVGFIKKCNYSLTSQVYN